MSLPLGKSAAPQNPVPDFLAKYPTPLHIFWESLALEDARELKKGLFSGLSTPELYYSVKTNPLIPLLRALLAEGWGMEAVGEENLRAARAAGTPADKILFNGAAWSRPELERAIFELGVTSFTVDSQPMAELLATVLRSRPAPRALDVALRLHDGNSHFGFPAHVHALRRALETFPADGIQAFGLQVHRNPAGSPASAAAIAEDFRERCFRVKAALAALEGTPWENKIDYVDLGGGIDSPHVYRPHPSELAAFHDPGKVAAFRESVRRERFTLREAGEAIAAVVRDELGLDWAKRRILFEPGRAACTRALSTLVEVKAVKRDFYPEAQVVITDGDTAFLGPLHRGVHPLSPGGERNSFVYGRLPHSGDWLFQSVALPELHEGDRLLIGCTGAYFLPLAASFGHSRPLIVRADRDETIAY
jgi:diaminopimelate decarboxylase